MYRRSTASLAGAAFLSFWIAGCSDDANPGDNNNATVDAAVDAQTDTGPQALALDLGEIVTVDASATRTAEVTLLTEGGDEEFLILAQSQNSQLNISRVFAVGLPQQRSRRVDTPAITPATTPDERLQRWGCLSGGGQVDLARVVDGLRGLPIPRGQVDRPVPRPVPPPNVGEMVDFEINANGGLVTVAAEVLLVSASLVVVLDRDTDPTLELDATMLADIASAFEDIVLPRERLFFGVESDVNDDNHITVLFSPLVNESGATAYVNPYDLVTDPAARPAGVAANDQELLYVTPPQLLPPHMGTVNGIVETLAHEFQHAIYFYRKYQLNDTVGDPESSYITEGLSALAQDITGYQAGNFFVAMSGLDDIDDISINDLVASQGGYYNDRDGPLRGGAYNLIRYLYDQAGGDVLLANGDVDLDNSPGVAWLRDLVDSPELGVANIETAAGQPLTDVATDWYTAQMVDDRTDAQDQPLNTDPLYNYLPTATDPLTGRTRGTSMFESFMGMAHKTGPLILDFDQADGWIRPGGAEYLRLTATQSPTTTFTLAADPDDVNLRLVIFRTR